MTRKVKDNIAAVIATVIVLVAIWFGFDAFFSLVGAIYAFLDLYIWAFFAGIIAFFFSVTIIMLMLKISLILILLATAGLIAISSVIVDIFNKR